MSTTTILEFAAAYVVLAVLLLSLNAVSLWRWWVKLGAVVVTTAFFGATYVFTTALLGWPSPTEPPQEFNLLWSKIVEPNPVNGVEGAIYLWAQELVRVTHPDGVLWVIVWKKAHLPVGAASWDDAQDAVLATGWVDNKILSLGDQIYATRYVRRRRPRKAARNQT